MPDQLHADQLHAAQPHAAPPADPGPRVAQPPSDPPPRIDLADPAFWELPAERRAAAFRRLRALPGPVHFTERPQGPLRGERGFHALVRHADVLAASRDPRVFRSAPGVTTPAPARWVRLLFGDSMVNLDDPRHAQLRRIVARSFTPRLLARAEADINATAARLVDRVIAERPADFVPAVAAQLPFQVICAMMGIPEQRRALILRQIDRASAHAGVHRSLGARIRLPGQGLRALGRMQLLVAELGRERRRRPAEDLISALVAADLDGRGLTGRELGAFFSLLLVAGVETTRNALAHGLHLLTVHPEQRALMLADPERHLDGAVDEILRHATPIIQFRRTLAADHQLGATRLARGEQVLLCYGSANRDEAVFPDPEAFDITRHPNPHLAFGGGGPHFCLGAHLARQEMKALYRELFARLPDIRATAAPEITPSSFDHRVRSLPFTFTPPERD
ncbi:cytochrome P450 [Kitasatospora sp. NBC_01287]|uniref:cytochrome P450 n=1 Tax=Kitasatospora sp. NBC_01287 TaxID=2903573 RepID=UPI00225A97B8|nr:cytochrome P450 [Kitasatospora sp. NBC_01287]MCX4751378.1 cytochrome P450 [Kitasatospora sp. NBC_01287]